LTQRSHQVCKAYLTESQPSFALESIMSTDDSLLGKLTMRQQWEDAVNADPTWFTLAIVLIIMLAS